MTLQIDATGKLRSDPTGKVLATGSPNACCCGGASACLSGAECLDVVIAGLAICGGCGNANVIAVPQGTYSLRRGGNSGVDGMCGWFGCFTMATPRICPDAGPANTFFGIGVTRINGVTACRIGVGGNCGVEFFYAETASDIADGLVLNNSHVCGPATCAVVGGGTVTLHTSTCSQTQPIDCQTEQTQCDCYTDATRPVTPCGVLPDCLSAILNLSPCVKSGCTTTCDIGTVLLTKSGSDCATAVYSGAVGSCATVDLRRGSGTWVLTVTDTRCSTSVVIWKGYPGDANALIDTYKLACGTACPSSTACEVRIAAGTCGGGCTSGCDGPCDDGSLPVNNGDGVALSVDLSGIVQCDGSALTGLGTATMTRFGGCSGGQFDGGNQGPANVPPADVDANIVWNDGAGYVLILSALPSSGTLWTGCSDTIEGTYTRVCDGYFGEGVVVCCSTNCDVDSIVVSAA